MFGKIEHHPVESQFRRHTHDSLSAVIENIDSLLIVDRERQRI